MRKHPAVALKQLGTGLAAPRSGTWRVTLDEPARTVMTDFSERNLVSVDAKIPVDTALEAMKHAGVRSAFVLDDDRARVLGLVTAHDILGEKPIRYLQSIGCTHLTCTRDDVKVENVMERAEEWLVARMEDVQQATVGAVLETFKKAGRTHIPVVEDGDGGAPRLRGIFSAAKLMRLTEESRRGGSAGAPARTAVG
jgi:CBS domain-containing protein